MFLEREVVARARPRDASEGIEQVLGHMSCFLYSTSLLVVVGCFFALAVLAVWYKLLLRSPNFASSKLQIARIVFVKLSKVVGHKVRLWCGGQLL